MKIFAERLKDLRMDENLSLDKLGEKIGVSGDNNYVQSGVLPAEDGEEGSGCGF